MNVLVVGPYPPRRCGIGVYARGQVERLRTEGHHVTVLSPPDGEGDLRASFLGGSVFGRAASLSPGFDRIIVHFQPALYYPPHRALAKVLTSLRLIRLVRRGRGRVDLLVHEADPPKLWRPDYLLLRRALRKAGRVSFHTEAERRALEHDYHVRVRGAVVPHVVEAVVPVSRGEARRRLGLGQDRGTGPLFVCAGFLQPSKGFDRAVDAFAGANEPNGADGARLYVVGSVREATPENAAYARELAERCRSVPGVTLVDRFLSDQEFDLWVAAADWLVLPYRRSWSSGVLARAHALGTPAIVSAVGGLREQAGGRDVVVGDDDGLREAMRTRGGGDPPASPGSAPPSPAAHSHPHDPRVEWDPEFEPPGEGKKGRGVLIALILISVVLAALAQLTLKHGMNQVTDQGAVPLDLTQPVHMVRRVATNVSVLGGLAIFVLSAAVWLVVLSRVSLSFAYPFASLTYVLILVFDRFVLDQPISGLRYAGVAFIITGLLLISRTHTTA